MKIALTIDPGIRGIGAALWIENRLAAAEYVKSTSKEGSGPEECARVAVEVVRWVGEKLYEAGVRSSSVTDLVLEWPQTYGGRSAKGDTNSLFPLAGIDGALAALYLDADASVKIHHVVPHDWKGSVEKPENTKAPYAIEGKVRERLDDEEAEKIIWPKAVKLTWDVTDAVGIGLHFAKRFDRKRVITYG